VGHNNDTWGGNVGTGKKKKNFSPEPVYLVSISDSPKQKKKQARRCIGTKEQNPRKKKKKKSRFLDLKCDMGGSVSHSTVNIDTVKVLTKCSGVPLITIDR